MNSELIESASKKRTTSCLTIYPGTWGAREDSAWYRQLPTESYNLSTDSEAETLNWEKADMKILAHSAQNVQLYWHYIVVNWVSELLHTAAVSSSPVILLSVHVHMCIYNGHTL